MLDRFHAPLSDLLAHFAGREEWTVTLTADEASVMQQIQNNDPQVLALQAVNKNRTPGEEYFLRKKIEKLSTAAAENLLGLLGRDIEPRLRSHSIELRRQALTAASPNPRLPVFSATLLVEKASVQSLEQALAQIESEYSCYGLCAELTGPWPPYDFTDTMADLGK